MSTSEYITEKEGQDFVSARDCRQSGFGKCNTCDIKSVCRALDKYTYPECLGKIGYPDASAGLDCMICADKCICDSLNSCLNEPENDISECYGHIEACDIRICSAACEFFNACVFKKGLV